MPGDTDILCLRQGSGEIELRPAADFHLCTGFAGLPCGFIVKLHAVRKLESDGLQLIGIEGDHLGPLAVPVHISLYVVIGEFHVHIGDVRHVLTVVIEFHRQLLSGIIRSGKGVRAAIGIRSRHMGDDKAFAGREIRILLSEEPFVSSRFGPVITNLRQRLPILQFGDGESPVSWHSPGRLHTVSSCAHAAELNRVLMGLVRAQTIIFILVAGAAGDLDCLGGRGFRPSQPRDFKAHGFTEPQGCQVDLFLLRRPLDHAGYSPTRFLIIGILGFRFLQHGIHLFRGHHNHFRICL